MLDGSSLNYVGEVWQRI